MTQEPFSKLAVTTLCAGAVFVTGMLLNTPSGKAQTTTPVTYDEASVAKGLAIAPVTLNFTGKDRNQVGYGSYVVNATGGCNDCHTNPSYTEAGDPFKGLTKKVNVAGYMAGGVAFGPFTSRNITPDATGAVAGGAANFKQIIRTGIDLKKLHTPISPLLQVMPWPVYQDLNDRELDAIYAYLTAIPCIEGGLGELPNRCVAAARTAAIATPKNATVVTRETQLDGSTSTASDGKALQYLWSIPQGSPSAAIRQGNSATPTVQFGTIRGLYTFQLTVTDSKGATATDTVSINFAGY